MAFRLAIFLVLLAGCEANRMNVEVARTAQQEEQNTQTLVAIEGQTLTQLLTTAVGIITSMVSSFSEEPPDVEYAIDALNIQGWKMVKIIVPAESQKDKKFRNANRAWKQAFGDAGVLIEDIMTSSQDGDLAQLLRAILDTVGTALRTCGAAFPDDQKYFSAFDGLAQGVGGAILDFGKVLGWMGPSASALVQIEGKAAIAPNLNQMLTTGVGVITSLISAFSEDPPDYEHAIDSVNLQGWKMVKLMVPKDEQRSDAMKRGKKAWDRAMGDATDLLEEILDSLSSGYMGKIIHAIMSVVDTALRATADIVVAEKEFLEALAEFLKRFAGSIVEFSVEMGWMAAP